MRNDPDFIEFLWLWNQRSALETPAIHRRIARWLMARREAGDRRLLLMAFRGCGKSTGGITFMCQQESGRRRALPMGIGRV